MAWREQDLSSEFRPSREQLKAGLGCCFLRVSDAQLCQSIQAAATPGEEDESRSVHPGVLAVMPIQGSPTARSAAHPGLPSPLTSGTTCVKDGKHGVGATATRGASCCLNLRHALLNMKYLLTHRLFNFSRTLLPRNLLDNYGQPKY